MQVAQGGKTTRLEIRCRPITKVMFKLYKEKYMIKDEEATLIQLLERSGMTERNLNDALRF